VQALRCLELAIDGVRIAGPGDCEADGGRERKPMILMKPEVRRPRSAGQPRWAWAAWSSGLLLLECIAGFAVSTACLVAGCSTVERERAQHEPGASPALRNEWVDADTGHRVVRLSRVPGTS